MATVPRSVEANLIRSNFGAFVRHAFRMARHCEPPSDGRYNYLIPFLLGSSHSPELSTVLGEVHWT